MISPVQFSFSQALEYYKGDVGGVRYLIGRGADVNERRQAYGAINQPIAMAIKTGSVDLVSLLVDAGADLNDSIMPALFAMAHHRQFQEPMLETLVEGGADINGYAENTGKKTLLCLVIELHGDVEWFSREFADLVDLARRCVRLGARLDGPCHAALEQAVREHHLSKEQLRELIHACQQEAVTLETEALRSVAESEMLEPVRPRPRM